MESAAAGRGKKVLMGTCGWSDQTLQRCARFYPASVKTAEDRLRHYSNHFPCVEVDTSTYAIPSPFTVGKWISATVPGFVFHFKAFGLFCSKTGSVSNIPRRIRGKVGLADSQTVRLFDDLTEETRDELWGIFNSAVQPAYDAGRLGVIVFQFHLSFKPSEDHRAHVEWCRKNLDSRYAMAVEFRSRDWFKGEQGMKTERWLASIGLEMICADELEHETFQRDQDQTGLAPGQRRALLPVAWPAFKQDFLYIRVHRREGKERLLSDEELAVWKRRLSAEIPEGFTGPIYFMWGTDWEDQPMINAKRLLQLLPEELAYDWKSMQKGNSRLQSMFKAASSKVEQSCQDTVRAPTVGVGKCSEDGGEEGVSNGQSANPGQFHQSSQDSVCLPATAASGGSFQDDSGPEKGQNCRLEESSGMSQPPTSGFGADCPQDDFEPTKEQNSVLEEENSNVIHLPPTRSFGEPCQDGMENAEHDTTGSGNSGLKRKLEGESDYKDAGFQKQVDEWNPSKKVDGKDSMVFAKSVLENLGDGSPVKQVSKTLGDGSPVQQLSKKGIQGKKPRAAGGSTPMITSFFKKAPASN